MKILSLLIEKIKADQRAQPRVELDQSLIDEYTAAMQENNDFPAVVVFADGDTYWLADGFHRYHAAKAAGRDAIPAEVHEGDIRKAILHSVGANAAHGLRRTNKDKRRAVLTLLQDKEWQRWSDGEIARRCAVSDRFVANLRRELSPNRSEIERKVERGGIVYTMNTCHIGEGKNGCDKVEVKFSMSPDPDPCGIRKRPPERSPEKEPELLEGPEPEMPRTFGTTKPGHNTDRICSLKKSQPKSDPMAARKKEAEINSQLAAVGAGASAVLVAAKFAFDCATKLEDAALNAGYPEKLLRGLGSMRDLAGRVSEGFERILSEAGIASMGEGDCKILKRLNTVLGEEIGAPGTGSRDRPIPPATEFAVASATTGEDCDA